MHAEARGEPVLGLVHIAEASINRANNQDVGICEIKGVTRSHIKDKALRGYFLAVARHALTQPVLHDMDSWNTTHKHGRKVGRHTFYKMKENKK